MYPNEIIFGYGLYEIMILIGIIACFLVFRFLITEKVMPAKVYNFYLITAVSSIILGFLFASLFQSFFDFLKTGTFKPFKSGMTFYGGLIGGVTTFLLLTYLVGNLVFKEKEHLTYFLKITQVAPCCVAIAHGFGRLGCLFAGCCHGKVTLGFGINMWVDELQGYYKCVPTQLFEAVFLFVLFGILTFMFFKNIHFELETYCILYGIWRFVIEYFRADDRGEFIIKFLTPSQGIAIIFVLVGVLLLLLKLLKIKNKRKIQ